MTGQTMIRYVTEDYVIIIRVLHFRCRMSDCVGSTRQNDGPATGRAPTLRKTGKSVSFQESTLADGVAYLRPDFPLVLRRGSIAPLAARIRANRPPTAPPGSLFVRGLSNVDDGECSR